MSIHGAAFLPSRASVYTTFLKNCGRGVCLRPTAYPTAVVGGKQGHAHVSVKFNGDHKTAYRDEVKSGHPQLL